MLVLVLDDDPASRFALGEMLRQAGHTVALFSSCDDVVNALIGGRRFDALILDMFIPNAGGHGPSCYQRILDISPVQASRVIFATGGGLPLAMERFLEGKPWIEKPIDAAELEAALASLPTGRS